MTESEERTDLLFVGPAVTDVDALLVFLVDDLVVIAPGAREAFRA